jgi:transposase
METFELDELGLKRFYSTIDLGTYVLIEATINTFAFASLFKQVVKQVVIANTYQLKSSNLRQHKTDKIDATKLAEKQKQKLFQVFSKLYRFSCRQKSTGICELFFLLTGAYANKSPGLKTASIPS